MEAGTKSNRSWLIALLIISLGINLLVVGMFVGRISKEHRPKHSHFDWMAKELNTSSREAVRKTMRAHMHDSEPLAKDLRMAQRNLKQVMSAEIFEEKAAVQAFALVREKSERFQETMHQGMMKTLSQLDRKERMRVFRMLSMRNRGGNQRRIRPLEIESNGKLPEKK
ncbi:MAG: putative membrane protein [Gammaproteobacteria bacterium]|jgi:uncharacterized membrane protein